MGVEFWFDALGADIIRIEVWPGALPRVGDLVYSHKHGMHYVVDGVEWDVGRGGISVAVYCGLGKKGGGGD